MLLLVILFCYYVVANFASVYYVVCRLHLLLNSCGLYLFLARLLSGLYSIGQFLLAFW
jgi:hypothetical protein